jgi:tRNA(adenine34) deaminase
MYHTSPFMEQALATASAGATLGEVPVGALIVKEGAVLASAHNLTETSCDPTAHAEMLVIRQAAAMLASPRLTGCDLYVTLEPCPMCAYAISSARIARLYIGAMDAKGGGIFHGPKLYTTAQALHIPEIYSGIGEQASADMLKQFFRERRDY